MSRLTEIDSRLEVLRAEIIEIQELPEPTDEDLTRTDVLLDERDALTTERAPLAERAQRVEAARAAAANPRNVEPAFHTPQVLLKKDPFENVDALRSGADRSEDVVSRAISGVEASVLRGVSDEAKQNAVRTLETNTYDPRGVARFALLTGSDAYRSAFGKFMENPTGFQQEFTPEEASAFRTALSTTAGNGGYTIPFLLDPTVILTNAGAANPFRQISRVETGTSNKWQGVTSAGVTAEWKTEGSAAADAGPTFAQPAITAYLADAFIPHSYEIAEDGQIVAQIPRLVADAKARLENTAFATGSGSGQPFGVVTSTTAVTASRVSPTTGGTFTSASIADVYKTIANLSPRYRSTSSHVANWAVYNIIRQMSASAIGSAFWANLGMNVPEELLGRPVYEASAMASSMTTGSNILLTGDFSEYLIYDRLGTQLEYIPNLFDQATGRPSGQRGYMAWWRVGADVTDATAFSVLKL